jgi:hypothetical protein
MRWESHVRFGGRRRGDHRPQGRHRRLAADPTRRASRSPARGRLLVLSGRLGRGQRRARFHGESSTLLDGTRWRTSAVASARTTIAAPMLMRAAPLRARRFKQDAACRRPSPARPAAGAASGVACRCHGAAGSRPRGAASPRSLPRRPDARSSSSQVLFIVCAGHATSRAGGLTSRGCPPLHSREEPPERGVEPTAAVVAGSLRAELGDRDPWADVRGLVHERVIPHRLERWRAVRGSAGRHELCPVEASASASRPRRWRSRK